MTGILYHFLNSEFLSLGVVPVNLRMLSITDQVAQPIWDMSASRPFWKTELSTENVIVLVLNLLLILAGIFALTAKLGIVGAIPLLIQIGYHLGNAFAKTSGGRYLQPVDWVTYLYFAVGLLSASVFVLNIFRNEKLNPFTALAVKGNVAAVTPQIGEKVITTKLLITFALVLLAGLALPLVNNLPNRMPEETSRELRQKTGEKLVEQGILTDQQWQSFIESPQSLVVEGIAYHPRIYRPNFYRNQDRSFEMMVLGKDHVLVSYLFDVFPENYFSDGSDVILVGCKLGSDTIWASDRLILRSFAIIQTDHERTTLVDPNTKWSCNFK